MKQYDFIIIGAGPCGLSGGLCAASSKLKTLIIEKKRIGGQITLTDKIENYPGAPKNSTGISITQRMKDQAESFGCEIITDDVLNIDKKGELFYIYTKNAEFSCKACLIASGSKPRKLNIKGEEKYIGMGVSYCAKTDVTFFKNMDVVVVGGGDSACQEAIYLCEFVNKVTVVHRFDTFNASKILQEKVFSHEKIDIILNSELTEIYGSDFVEGVKIFDKNLKNTYEYKTDGVFIFIGNSPCSEEFKDVVSLDEDGYIITDNNLSTIVDGLYAAGDVRRGSLKQVITACADGTVSAVNAQEYINNIR